MDEETESLKYEDMPKTTGTSGGPGARTHFFPKTLPQFWLDVSTSVCQQKDFQLYSH